MELQRYPTAEAFLAGAEPFLLQAEVENSLILGVAHALASGVPAQATSPYFAAILDSEIRLCAFSSLPDKLGITRCGTSAALALLAQDARVACPDIDTIVGPQPTVAAFAEQFAVLRACPVRQSKAMRIHELTAVTWPDDRPSGQFRAAQPSDLPVLTSWVREFASEVDDDQGDPEQLAASRVVSGQLFVWDDGHPVSMAGWTGRTPHTVRVAPVYTPPPLRSRGYATACVAALSQAMLDTGVRSCCLYKDLANPTSTAIYRRIGYRAVSDAGSYTLTPSGA